MFKYKHLTNYSDGGDLILFRIVPKILNFGLESGIYKKKRLANTVIKIFNRVKMKIKYK